MAEQEKRKSPKMVDFILLPGYLDGSPGVRENVGLPVNTGLHRVITEKAIFCFDEKTRCIKLLALTPWATVDDVFYEMDFKPLIAESLGIAVPPTNDQLTLLRTDIEPKGRVINVGKWTTYT